MINSQTHTEPKNEKQKEGNYTVKLHTYIHTKAQMYTQVSTPKFLCNLLSPSLFMHVAHPGLNDHEIGSQATVLLFAGYETSASTLSFLAYNLARNPAVMKRLQEEIDSTFPNRVEQTFLVQESFSPFNFIDESIVFECVVFNRTMICNNYRVQSNMKLWCRWST